MNGITPISLEDLQAAVAEQARTGGHLHYARPWRTCASSATEETPGQAADQSASCSTPVDLSAWNAVIDYPHRDMTITVQTGITLQELRACLAEQNQWLPVDVPWPDRLRVADLILDHWYGSLSAGHGTIRDWLLGLTAIDGAGRVFHAGGRVVKNVAGYDLCKLLVGSAGELGLPMEATLQVRSLPAEWRGCRVQVSHLARLQEAWRVIRSLPVKPVVLDAFPAEQGFALHVVVEGSASVTPQLIDRLRLTLRELPGTTCDEFDWDPHQSCWGQLNLPQSATTSASTEPFSGSLLRVGVRPSQSFTILDSATDSAWQAVVLAARGTVLLVGPETPDAYENWQRMWQSWQHLQPGLQVLHAPAEWQTQAQTLRVNSSAWPLCERLQNVFNPHHSWRYA